MSGHCHTALVPCSHYEKIYNNVFMFGHELFGLVKQRLYCRIYVQQAGVRIVVRGKAYFYVTCVFRSSLFQKAFKSNTESALRLEK